jgi:hypothetical protein
MKPFRVSSVDANTLSRLAHVFKWFCFVGEGSVLSCLLLA